MLLFNIFKRVFQYTINLQNSKSENNLITYQGKIFKTITMEKYLTNIISKLLNSTILNKIIKYTKTETGFIIMSLALVIATSFIFMYQNSIFALIVVSFFLVFYMTKPKNNVIAKRIGNFALIFIASMIIFITIKLNFQNDASRNKMTKNNSDFNRIQLFSYSLKDPDSFEVVTYKTLKNGNIKLIYRAKNGFGATVTETAIIK